MIISAPFIGLPFPNPFRVAGLLYLRAEAFVRYSAALPGVIELFDMHIGLSYSCGEITGLVRNHSGKALRSVKLRVNLSDTNGPIDAADTEILVDVPMGEDSELEEFCMQPSRDRWVELQYRRSSC